MNVNSTARIIGKASSVVMPAGGDTFVQPPPPKPCVTIVVHGVNDLAGVYASIEQGLCEGLNERLDLAFQPDGAPGAGRLEPATYTSPADDYGVASNPDAVYYRRRFSDSSDGRAARSVVIPFYWGFREEEAFIDKTTPHGEWLDRNGNRLDKAGTKEGGQFANATTTLPDMWGEGFSGKLFGFIPMHWFSPDPSHPLFRSAARKYMVLAAMRLAMLIRIIRKRYPDDVINVVGHSQGNMLNLLAQAMLADEGGTRPADCCIMMNPPYSLHEPWTEGVQMGHRQQTTRARVETLKKIVAFIDAQAVSSPALPELTIAGCPGYGAIGGPRWTGGKGSKVLVDGQEQSFDDTDNRGCTYLYFTPQDQTVGLANVQGIGWQGVPEVANGKPARSVLSSRFHQRVFTLRRRNGEREKVGSRETIDRYVLRRPGEKTWEDTGLGWFDSMRLSRASFDENQSVQLRGHRLPVPLEVDYAHEGTVTVGNAPSDKDATDSGVYQVKTPYDPIDAAIVLANGGWEPKNRAFSQEELLDEQQVYRYGSGLAQITESRNVGREAADKAEVFSAQKLGNGQVLIVRGETPYEARIRLQNQELHQQVPLSFHSGIPANPEHSRRVLAFDVAVGAGRSVDDLEFYAYLCRVADWRLDWEKEDGDWRKQDHALAGQPSEMEWKFYVQELPDHRRLMAETSLYRSSDIPEYDRKGTATTGGGGVLPASVQSAKYPTLVTSQTFGAKPTWGVVQIFEGTMTFYQCLVFGIAAAGVSMSLFAAPAEDTHTVQSLQCASTSLGNPDYFSALNNGEKNMSEKAKYSAPTSSGPLDTLDVLSVGLSLDVFRQGQAWQALEQSNSESANSLLAKSILPMDSSNYPIKADDKDIAYDKRKSDALELGLKNFLEKWPIPTVTVVRDWNANYPNPRVAAENVSRMLKRMVNRMRGDAGLHWHGIRGLENGIVCNSNPEGLVESLFQLFERHPDLPAVLVYSVESYNMAMTLSDRSEKPIGVGTGPRQPGELTDAMVALVVGRPERVDWLRYYAPFTKVHKNPINPQFTGWGWRKPKVPFQPTKFIPEPWTERAFQQWDAVPVLAKLHRPVKVALNNDAGKRLKNDALYAALEKGWSDAIQGLPTPPARAFFDTGKPENTALAEWVPALRQAHSSLDLLASEQSYNLTQRLGDTGSSSPFVGIALATMASFMNGDSSVVMPLRRADRATLIPITSPTPGEKPPFNPFGIRLMPQHSSSNGPDPIFVARMHEAQMAQQPTLPTRFIDPEQVARDKQTLDDFLASGPGVDLTSFK